MLQVWKESIHSKYNEINFYSLLCVYIISLWVSVLETDNGSPEATNQVYFNDIKLSQEVNVIPFLAEHVATIYPEHRVISGKKSVMNWIIEMLGPNLLLILC